MHPQLIHIFVGYAREDKHHLETFRRYVADLERDNVRIFDDRSIPGGEDWEQRLFAELNKANIVVFLITPSFISSDFCMHRELPAASDRQKAGGCVVLPLKVEPFDLTDSSPLAKMQWVPSGKPITSHQGAAKRRAWADVAKKVRQTVQGRRTGNLKVRLADEIHGASTRKRSHLRRSVLVGGTAILLVGVVTAWLVVRSLDDPPGFGAAEPPVTTTTQSTGPKNRDLAPPASSCVGRVICRYLRLAPGQGFNLDTWRADETNPTLTLLGDGGLGINPGTAKIALAPELSRQPADPLPCPNKDAWTSAIPQIPYNQGVCVKTPAGKYFLLIHLEQVPDQQYEKFLAAGFPE